MFRRLMTPHEESGFTKPDGVITLKLDENCMSDMYPILDGVVIGVWNISYWSNWLEYYTYDSEGNQLSHNKWKERTTLTKDDGYYFKAGIATKNNTAEVRAEWM